MTTSGILTADTALPLSMTTSGILTADTALLGCLCAFQASFVSQLIPDHLFLLLELDMHGENAGIRSLYNHCCTATRKLSHFVCFWFWVQMRVRASTPNTVKNMPLHGAQKAFQEQLAALVRRKRFRFTFFLSFLPFFPA